MLLINQRRSADAQYLLTLQLEVTVENPVMSFWTVTFLTYGTACLECFRTVAS